MSMKTVLTMDERCEEVFEMLVDALGLDDVSKDEINFSAPLFASMDDEGEGLELDSVDALEIVVALKSRYGIKLENGDKSVLNSIVSIAEFINQKLDEDK